MLNLKKFEKFIRKLIAEFFAIITCKFNGAAKAANPFFKKGAGYY